MRTPNGSDAGDIDPVMLLALWTHELILEDKRLSSSQKPKLITAGIGKPTFPVNPDAICAEIEYLREVETRTNKARRLLTDKIKAGEQIRDEIVSHDAAHGYGDPRGDKEPREKMALALNKWYETTIFTADDILFTVGGSSGLYSIFEYLNQIHPHGRIVTPVPYYSLDTGHDKQNRLHPIDVMDCKGYKLTPEALEKSIRAAEEAAKLDGGDISSFLFCFPNNPLGTDLNADEWTRVANVLREYIHKHPNVLIILDECYAELSLSGKKAVSLLTVAPDLIPNIALLRSSTKCGSNAGSRAAVLVTTNPTAMAGALKAHVNVNGHAPREQTRGYAESMTVFDDLEHRNLVEFYKPQVELVKRRLATMGASMPDKDYDVISTFYVMSDFSELKNLELPAKAKEILGDSNKSGKTETSQDIAYYLLCKDRVMIAPGQYNGLDEKKGYMRITCSMGDSALTTLMDRLEHRLTYARLLNLIKTIDKFTLLITKLPKENGVIIKQWEAEVNSICANLSEVLKEEINAKTFITNTAKYIEKIRALSKNYETCSYDSVRSSSPGRGPLSQIETPIAMTLKTINVALTNLTNKAEYDLTSTLPAEKQIVIQNKAATKIQATWRRHHTSRIYNKELKIKWKEFVTNNYKDKTEQLRLLAHSEKRHGITFWNEYVDNGYKKLTYLQKTLAADQNSRPPKDDGANLSLTDQVTKDLQKIIGSSQITDKILTAYISSLISCKSQITPLLTMMLLFSNNLADSQKLPSKEIDMQSLLSSLLPKNLTPPPAP